jgi:putative ABC transport system permease protein
MENLRQDIRYGARTLRKKPGFTTVAIVTLALGIGANTAIFSVVQNLLLRPLPYPNPEQLVEIANTYLPQVPKADLTPGDYSDWRRQNTSFSEMGAYTKIVQGFNLSGDGDPQRIQVAYADSGLFPMLGFVQPWGAAFSQTKTAPKMRRWSFWDTVCGSAAMAATRTWSAGQSRLTSSATRL